MRGLSRPLLVQGAALLALGAALWLWGLGGASDLAARAAGAQHEVQDAMARALRALRAGEPGALWALWGLCFGYGVLHAAGPGHGKLVVGSYGLGRRVRALKLAGLALAASLAQAATAVLLVLAGLLALGLTREGMQGLADRHLAVLSALMIAALGAWLAWRGARSLRRLAAPAPAPAPAPAAAQVHAYDPNDLGALAAGVHPAACAACGHAHGPTAAEAERVGTPREALALVAAVAARPCTGALFLLVLTWRMGLFGAGVAGAFAMALGTAAVTVAAALASVALREGALLRAGPGRGAARALALAELGAGAAVALIALAMLRQAA
jgi:ABC-type nickel/cobalt efflux system permease component RcnA